MIKNYLKIAWRNLLKHKSFSLINILGLTIGIAACIIIFTYVSHELTYDQYNPHADRIARITLTLKTPEADMAFATTPFPLADALKREYPEVAATARLQPTAATVKSNNDLFKESGFYLADQSLFSVFLFSFKEGSAASALKNPDCIVLTETTAKKYFPQGASVIGKRIVCNGKDLLVTGIVADRPANSDISINALLSADFSKITSWMGEDFSVYTFILFKEKPDLRNFAQKLIPLSTKYVQPELDAAGATKYHGLFELEPLKEVHFSQGKLVDTPKGNKQFNYIFSLLAVFILIIALLNYINLSTAKATERAKEVGIRKLSGAL
ncbi:MAG TPA: ABC transporter permease, partial [Puia sp.]|nr:ABC transporter permease [Puia sp.]